MGYKPKSIKHNKVFEEIVEQIEQAMINGELKPGDCLPSELQMKEQFQTSRSSVREAIRVLEARGLIEIRQGIHGGTFAKGIESRTVADNMVRFLQINNIPFDDIARFREVLEGEASSMVAQHVTPQMAAELNGLLAKAREVLEKNPADWEGHYDYDDEIHVAIARMTGNELFIAVLSSLHFKMLDEDDRFAPKAPELLWENYEGLSKIVTAIVQQKPEEAELAAREHVRIFNEHMKHEARLLQTDKAN
jgi:DNA-binding FadR family transcriptional regulator